MLVTRPLEMAPCEPLDDAETMRDRIKQWGKTRTQTSGTLALPGRRWELGLSLAHSAACRFIYFSVSKFYNLDYRSMKKGDSTEMEVTAAHTRCPVASVVSGVVGVSGGGVEGRIRVFRYLTSVLLPLVFRSRNA